MGLFTSTALYNFQPIITSAAFVYYGATPSGSQNLGFQHWFKGVTSVAYGSDPIPSSSYTVNVRSIENAASNSAYTVPSGQLFNITGSVSGSGTLRNLATGTYPNSVGDERAGNGVGYAMLVQGPSDLRSFPLNSMPRPFAQRIRINSALASQPFNYIDGTGSVVSKTLTSGVNYYIDVQGVQLATLENNATAWNNFGLDGVATGSFTAYVEGTRQYTATKTRGSNMMLNWVKQYATASMNMQNALVSAASYTFIAAIPPNSSNFTYAWSGSGII
jgi:hypothetical protein